MKAPRPIDVANIEEAARVIDPVFLRSPQFGCESVAKEVGFDTVLKIESMNPIRSFKGRGAEYFAHRHDEDERPWICASAGNFGQGLAYAARKRSRPLLVFAATTANPFKVERMRSLGAEVRLEGGDFDESKDACRAHAEKEALRFIEDGHEPSIAEGAGTIAMELLRWPEPLDALLIPVGNGALICGMGHWVKHHSPATRVVGVGIDRAPAMARSFESGKKITTSEPVRTIADGVATRVPVQAALDEMARVVDDMILVEEAEVHRAMRRLFQAPGLVAEGAGAVPLAAAFAHRERFEGQRVGILVCGGNLTAQQMQQHLM